jgi:hypothetical protein
MKDANDFGRPEIIEEGLRFRRKFVGVRKARATSEVEQGLYRDKSEVCAERRPGIVS